MGSFLCCMRSPNPSQQIHDEEESIQKAPPRKGKGQEITIIGDLTLQQCLLSPPNLNVAQSIVSGKDDGNQVTIIRTTLKQCLLDSPNLTPQVPTNGGLAQKYCLASPHIQSNLSSHQTPNWAPEWGDVGTLNHHSLSSPEVLTEFFTPRLSFSSDKLGKLGKVDQIDDEEEDVIYTSIMRRSQSRRLNKKVSFKEEAQIYIFCSSNETFEEQMIV